MSDFQFEQLEPWSMRPEEQQEKEIWKPSWNCFCCQDTGKVQLNLVRQVIPGYDDNRDRLPICQNCNEGHKWYHLEDLDCLDMRLSPQTCRKLDAYARDDWKKTTETWFQWAKNRVSESTAKICKKRNLRQRDRIQAEFILAQRKHAKARGDWEEIEVLEVEGSSGGSLDLDDEQ